MSKLHLIRFALVLINIALLGVLTPMCAWANEPVQSFAPSEWTPMAPRDEIRPTFSVNPKNGPAETGTLVIEHDARKGLDGWYQKSFEVTSGKWYEFHALRQLTNVSHPRRSALVRILWQDSTGQMVSSNVPESQSKELGHVPSAEPEHPVDVQPMNKAGPSCAEFIKYPRKQLEPSSSSIFSGLPAEKSNGARLSSFHVNHWQVATSS